MYTFRVIVLLFFFIHYIHMYAIWHYFSLLSLFVDATIIFIFFAIPVDFVNLSVYSVFCFFFSLSSFPSALLHVLNNKLVWSLKPNVCVCFCYYYRHRCRIRSHQGYIIPSFILPPLARLLAPIFLAFYIFLMKQCTVGLLFSFQLFTICRMLYDFSVNVCIVLCHCLILSNVVHRIN